MFESVPKGDAIFMKVSEFFWDLFLICLYTNQHTCFCTTLLCYFGSDNLVMIKDIYVCICM